MQKLQVVNCDNTVAWFYIIPLHLQATLTTIKILLLLIWMQS